MSTGSRRSSRKRGFTLVEILAVLLLLGVLTGLAIPRFTTTTRDLELANSARNLAKLLTYAQERAIVERVPHQAVFDPVGGRYWLSRLEPQGEQTVSVRIAGRYGRTVAIPQGMTFRFPERPIQFYPDGSSDPFSIELATQTRRFQLSDGVGYVRIQEEKG